MLGREVVESARRAAHEVDALDHHSLDITDDVAVRDVLDTHRPDLIVNCAAFTAVDRCEADPDLAFAVNATGPRHLAAGARAVGARLVHVSTDYVFDGTKVGPYTEHDLPNPHSVYGASKRAGELEVLKLGPDGLVVRTAWTFGRHGANMVKTVLAARTSTSPLRFVHDQVGSPTSAADLSGLLIDLATVAASGVIHAANQGSVSWYEFVGEILRQCGDDPGRVEPIRTVDLDPPRAARRPANSVLTSVRLADYALRGLRPYESALGEVLAELSNG